MDSHIKNLQMLIDAAISVGGIFKDSRSVVAVQQSLDFVTDLCRQSLGDDPGSKKDLVSQLDERIKNGKPA